MPQKMTEDVISIYVIILVLRIDFVLVRYSSKKDS